MNWLSPNFLLAAAAIALPLALHLLRRRVTRTVPFPALRFLKTNNPRDRRQNFYRRLVLTLRCLVLALLAAAFARPFFGQPASTSARTTVVVIDNSFSLQAPDRWPQLKDWARRELGNPSTGDTVGLLLMNPRPSWLVAPTRDTAAALAALNDLQPGWETTRAEPAVRLAADTLAASAARSRKLIYLGDHQTLGWAGTDFARHLPAGVSAVFPEKPSASPKQQTALLSPALSPSGDTLTATVVVRHFGPAARTSLRLFASDNREPVHLETLDLAADETRTVRVTLPASTLFKKWIRFEIDPDALPADDTAWAVFTRGAGAPRMIFMDPLPDGAEADYVATACQTFSALSDRFVVTTSPRPIIWPPGAPVILRNESSFSALAAPRLDAFLAAGGSALIFLDGGTDQFAWLARHGITPVARPAADARIRDWAVDHPLVAPLAAANLRSLVGWSFKRGWSLPADSVEPLASWSDGAPALGEVRLGSGRVLIAGFTADRRDGEWPLAPAFVPFLHRAVLHLLETGSIAVNAAVVGQPLTLPDGEPGSWRALAGPSIDQPPAPAGGALTPRAPGIYEWTRGRERTLYAINVPPEESDLASWSEGTPWTQLESTERVAPSAAVERLQLADQDAEQQSPLWWWCFAAMAVFALTELTFANRTTR